VCLSCSPGMYYLCQKDFSKFQRALRTSGMEVPFASTWLKQYAYNENLGNSKVEYAWWKVLLTMGHETFNL
jgi:hypothetical protein